MKKYILFMTSCCLSSQMLTPAYATEKTETIQYNFENEEYMMQEENGVLGYENISSVLEQQYRDLITENYKNGVVFDISLEEYIGTINQKVNYDDYILEKNQKVNF